MESSSVGHTLSAACSSRYWKCIRDQQCPLKAALLLLCSLRDVDLISELQSVHPVCLPADLWRDSTLNCSDVL